MKKNETLYPAFLAYMYYIDFMGNYGVAGGNKSSYNQACRYYGTVTLWKCEFKRDGAQLQCWRTKEPKTVKSMNPYYYLDKGDDAKKSHNPYGQKVEQTMQS